MKRWLLGAKISKSSGNDKTTNCSKRKGKGKGRKKQEERKKEKRRRSNQKKRRKKEDLCVYGCFFFVLIQNKWKPKFLHSYHHHKKKGGGGGETILPRMCVHYSTIYIPELGKANAQSARTRIAFIRTGEQ